MIALFLPLRAQIKHWNYVDLPTGRVAFADPSVAELYRWVAARTQPGEAYFGSLSIAFPLRLFNPAPINYVLRSPYIRPEQVDETIAAIEKYKAPLVTELAVDLSDSYSHAGNPLQTFQDYLEHHYRLVKTFFDGETAWERVEAEPRTIPK